MPAFSNSLMKSFTVMSVDILISLFVFLYPSSCIVRVMYPVQVNGVFVQMPRHIWTELQKQYFFYDWDMDNDVVRWLCSFDTTEDDINSFVEALKRLG